MDQIPKDVMDLLSEEELEMAYDLEQRFHRAFFFKIRGEDQEFLIFGQPTLEEIRLRAGIVPGAEFEVYYYDQEGDVIEVRSQVELEEMCQVAEEVEPNGIFQFFVDLLKDESESESDDESESESDDDESESESDDESDDFAQESEAEDEDERYHLPGVCKPLQFEEEKEKEKEKEKEEVKEEAKDEFPLPDSFKAKVLELEGIMEMLGCVGLSRKELIGALFQHNWEVDEPLFAQLLEERAKKVEVQKQNARFFLKNFLASPEGDMVFERLAEKMVEGDGDVDIVAFAKTVVEMKEIN